MCCCSVVDERRQKYTAATTKSFIKYLITVSYILLVLGFAVEFIFTVANTFSSRCLICVTNNNHNSVDSILVLINAVHFTIIFYTFVPIK